MIDEVIIMVVVVAGSWDGLWWLVGGYLVFVARDRSLYLYVMVGGSNGDCV